MYPYWSFGFFPSDYSFIISESSTDRHKSSFVPNFYIRNKKFKKEANNVPSTLKSAELC